MRRPSLPTTSLRSSVLLVFACALLLPAMVWLLADRLVGGGVTQALDRHRSGVLLMVAVQGLSGAALLLVVLSRRFLWPLDRLADQAASLALLDPVPPLNWPDDDEFGYLAHELDGVRATLQELGTETQSQRSQLQNVAMVDPLTRLPNRALMAELFVHEAANARRGGSALALLHLGLDHFKAFNDAHGAAAGDELLSLLGQRMAAGLRESDAICRKGGDEFLLLLSTASGWDQVASAAKRVLRNLEQAIELPRSGVRTEPHASIGIAMYPSDGGDFEALERTAALALDRSKQLGRSRFSFYQPGLETAQRTRVQGELDLRRALAQQELELHFQPVVDARDGEVLGCEALLRWRHPARGLLAPQEFLPLARECGLMRKIDAWVLQAACSELAAWLDAGLQPGRMSINLSIQQARNPKLSEILQAALERHGLVAQHLEIEVTEDTFAGAGDAKAALRALARWRALGLALTVDDFGRGHSSLSLLKNLRPDRLKIDCDLVRGLPDDGGDCALAEAMLAMAGALGIEVVAEGVENAAQRAWLLSRGCVRQQGHLHGQPMAGEAIRHWLTVSASTAAMPEPA